MFVFLREECNVDLLPLVCYLKVPTLVIFIRQVISKQSLLTFVLASANNQYLSDGDIVM